jgi:hypothetical protein
VLATGLSLNGHYRDRDRHFTSFFNRLSLLQRETTAVTKSEIALIHATKTDMKRRAGRRPPHQHGAFPARWARPDGAQVPTGRTKFRRLP